MPTYSKNTRGEFTPAPAGLHRAVCVDVVDLGAEETAFGIKPKVRLVWLIEAKMDDGRPFHVQSKYTNSMHPKSLLHQAIVGWRGRPFSDDDMNRMAKGPGFDLDTLIGRNCQLQLMHEAGRDGTMYANVKAILPPAAGAQPLRVPAEYIRAQDRPQRPGGNGPARKPLADDGWDDVPPPTEEEIAAYGGPDDDIPF
jgi:hypothetical protein